MTQVFCEAGQVLDIHPSAFVPPPKIFSSVVHFIPRAKLLIEVNKDSLELICKIAFNQRRKILRSSLKQLNCKTEALLESASINPLLRPEDLTPEDFCKLANAYDQISRI
jgi:16S rRNA (adenine1518-N6/adenine1519-N6)-dimethyltransferase